jgi:APA family basic amino acid/polyamine antiporter
MTKSSKSELIRSLTLTGATMIVAGSMIGSGIFRKPATMAGQLLSPELLLIVWIAAGLITLVGALINAEIAGMIDSTGGQYIYLREMYGDFTAYMYGWSILSVIQTGSQAAIAYVFAEYLNSYLLIGGLPESFAGYEIYMPFVGMIKPFAEFGTKSIAIIVTLFLTGVNYIGVFFGGIVQTLVTFVKIASIIGLSILIFLLGDGSAANFTTGFDLPHESTSNLISVFGLALAGAFWAYDGWNNVTFVSGEIKNPQRNVPLALIYGTLIVIAVYVFINMAFLFVLPVDEMKNSDLVARTAAEKIFGLAGGTVISIAVIISAFGALNGSILATARVQFAMARKGMFFESLGRVHPKFATPHISLLVQGIWSAVLVLSGSFDTISDYVIFAAWLFYMLGAFGIFILRRKMPDAPRKFKMWGYPWTPAIFVIFSFLFLVNTIISDTENAMMGLMLILSGLPFYFYIRYRNKKQEGTDQRDEENSSN